MEKRILHIDVNNAFLSWTAVDRLKHGDKLDLRTIPAIIGGDESQRKGIVVAKSNIAKQFGIKTGEPIYQARKKCPNLKVYRGNYKSYQNYSLQLYNLLLEYTDKIERYSIDECFMDLTEYLMGRSLEEIAIQKAGIIKQNSNTVVFENNDEIDKIFKDICMQKNNKLYLIKKTDITNYSYDTEYQYFDYDNLKNIKVNLKGLVQINNASICIKTMEILNNLGYKIREESIRKGLSTVIHRGRMEEICKNPLIIYDGGHNEPAIKNLLNSVNMYYKDLNRTYIISILKRKDYETMLELLFSDEKASFILTSGNDKERYASAEELYKVAIKYKRENQKIKIKSLEEAIKEIKRENRQNTVNFVIGSFYVYGDVIKYIGNK